LPSGASGLLRVGRIKTVFLERVERIKTTLKC